MSALYYGCGNTRQCERSKGLPFVHAVQDGLFRLDDELDALVERFQILIRDDTSDLRARVFVVKRLRTPARKDDEETVLRESDRGESPLPP